MKVKLRRGPGARDALYQLVRLGEDLVNTRNSIRESRAADDLEAEEKFLLSVEKQVSLLEFAVADFIDRHLEVVP